MCYVLLMQYFVTAPGEMPPDTKARVNSVFGASIKVPIQQRWENWLGVIYLSPLLLFAIRLVRLDAYFITLMHQSLGRSKPGAHDLVFTRAHSRQRFGDPKTTPRKPFATPIFKPLFASHGHPLPHNFSRSW